MVCPGPLAMLARIMLPTAINLRVAWALLGLAFVAAAAKLEAPENPRFKDPKDYRWSGYAEAVAGSKRIRRGLCRVMGVPYEVVGANINPLETLPLCAIASTRPPVLLSYSSR